VVFDDAPSSNLFVAANVVLSKVKPHLPVFIQTSNYFNSSYPKLEIPKNSFPHTNVVFRVITTTNFQGAEFPSRISVDYFLHRSRDGSIQEHHSRHVDILLKSISRPDAFPAIPPVIDQRVSIEDMRYWFSNPPAQVSLVVSNKWPDLKDLNRKYEYRK
jgi:hypothetical protein